MPKCVKNKGASSFPKGASSFPRHYDDWTAEAVRALVVRGVLQMRNTGAYPIEAPPPAARAAAGEARPFLQWDLRHGYLAPDDCGPIRFSPAGASWHHPSPEFSTRGIEATEIIGWKVEGEDHPSSKIYIMPAAKLVSNNGWFLREVRRYVFVLHIPMYMHICFL
jgi:hypothetical protein